MYKEHSASVNYNVQWQKCFQRFRCGIFACYLHALLARLYSFTRCTYMLHFTLLTTCQFFSERHFLLHFLWTVFLDPFFDMEKIFFWTSVYSLLSFCFLKAKCKKKKINFHEYSLIIFCVSIDDRFFVARLYLLIQDDLL